jgi:hypothetical protein
MGQHHTGGPADSKPQHLRDVTDSMQGFEPCREGANPSGGTIGLKLKQISSALLKRRLRVQVSPGRPLNCGIV